MGCQLLHVYGPLGDHGPYLILARFQGAGVGFSSLPKYHVRMGLVDGFIYGTCCRHQLNRDVIPGLFFEDEGEKNV